MHAAYLALCEPDFLPLGHLRAMAVLVAALAMDACSTGKDDEDLCREGHDLAITYNFSKPQRHAAVAQVMRVARQVAGADIFADLGHSDRDKLRGEWGGRGRSELLDEEGGCHFC